VTRVAGRADVGVQEFVQKVDLLTEARDELPSRFRTHARHELGAAAEGLEAAALQVRSSMAIALSKSSASPFNAAIFARQPTRQETRRMRTASR